MAKPYFTEAELLILDMLLSGTQPSGMTTVQNWRAGKVRAKLREYAEERAERKAAQGRGRRAARE